MEGTSRGSRLGGGCCRTVQVRISGNVLPSSSQGEDGLGLTTGGTVVEQLRCVLRVRTPLLRSGKQTEGYDERNSCGQSGGKSGMQSPASSGDKQRTWGWRASLQSSQVSVQARNPLLLQVTDRELAAGGLHCRAVGHLRVGKMTRYTGAEALQFVLDTSDEESTFSSEEERDYSDDDRLYFEERLDPAVDRISDENVAKRAKTNIQTSNKESTLSWKTETDIDMVPQTLRFLPARELGPQLSSYHRDQVVNLQALPSEEENPALAFLCPVRSLHLYVDRTQSIRTSDQLFVCYGGQQKGKAVSKQRMAHWIVDAIALAYEAQGVPCLPGLTAHSNRSAASSWECWHSAPR
ncbi:unnamed protein product [Leuciscus chuanchicus]